VVRAVFHGCWVGLLLAAAAEVGRVLWGTNFHTVVPGRVYRCAQLSGPALTRLIQAHGIRTVVNLRGCCAPFPWYLDECRATHHRDVAQEDVCFSAGRLPSGPELRRLVEVLDRTEYPILLHCRRGADRTGLTAAVLLLLQTDTDLPRARRQLGWRFGHFPLGRPANLDWFLDLYEEWLAGKHLAHSPAHFRRWAVHDYCPGICRAAIEPVAVPARVPRGEPFALRVRVRNSSVQTWHLRPETNAGVHVRYVLWDDADQQLASARSGLFRQDVAPGQAVDLTLAVPALKKPGRYRVLVDMMDEQQCWFFQTGSEPLEAELEVRE
jgi:hypothetical protein